MLSTLIIIGLGCTTAIAALCWWSASRRVAMLKDRYDAALTELWAFKDVVRFAGRCAWHAANDAVTHPPQHLVASHMVEHYAAGFEVERASEDLATAGWNGTVGESA